MSHGYSTHSYRVEHPQRLIAREAEMYCRNSCPPHENDDTEVIEHVTAPGHQLAVVLKNMEAVSDEHFRYQFRRVALTPPNR
jgi:hypothetical protein